MAASCGGKKRAERVLLNLLRSWDRWLSQQDPKNSANPGPQRRFCCLRVTCRTHSSLACRLLQEFHPLHVLVKAKHAFFWVSKDAGGDRIFGGADPYLDCAMDRK